MEYGLNNYARSTLTAVIGTQATETLDAYIKEHRFDCWDIAFLAQPEPAVRGKKTINACVEDLIEDNLREVYRRISELEHTVRRLEAWKQKAEGPTREVDRGTV